MHRLFSVVCASIVSGALCDSTAMALGAHTGPGDYPWVVSVKTPSGVHVSTGILVDSRTVVIPGHVAGGAGWSVVAGAADLNNLSGAEMSMVVGSTVHPSYGECGALPDCAAPYPHNIAYLELATPLSTPPAVFAPSYLDLDEEAPWMVGWWQTNPCMPTAQFDPQQRFANISPTSTGVVLGPDRAHGTFNDVLGTSGTGGVVVVDYGGIPVVAGFLSFSNDMCNAAQPHTFTNTGYFHDWIPGVTVAPPLTGRDVVRVSISGTGSFVTSGIVVDPQWILTTGNDVENMLPSELVADGIQVTCIAFAPGFGYNGCQAPVNDLALLKLSEPTFSPVQELATGPDDYAQSTGTAMWWLWYGPMRSTNMPIIDNDDLASRWGPACVSDGNIGVYPATEIDVLTGGLFVGETLVGMASWWKSNGPTYQDPAYPYVYTRISEYADWIQETITNGTTGPCANECLFHWTGQAGDQDPLNPDNWSPTPGVGGPTGSVAVVDLDPSTTVGVNMLNSVFSACELYMVGADTGTPYGATAYFTAHNSTVDVEHDVLIDEFSSLGLVGLPGETSRLECENLTVADRANFTALTNDPNPPATHELVCDDWTIESGGSLALLSYTNLEAQCASAGFGGRINLFAHTRLTLTIAGSYVDNSGLIDLGRLGGDSFDTELSMTAQLRNKAGASFDGLTFNRVINRGILIDESTLAATSLVNSEQGYLDTTGNAIIDLGHGPMTNAGWFEVVSGTTEVVGSIGNVTNGLVRVRSGATLRADAFTALGSSRLEGTVETAPPANGAMAAAAGLGIEPEPLFVVASDVQLTELSQLDMKSGLMVVGGHLDVVHASTLRMTDGTVLMQSDGRRFSVQDEARVDLHQGTLRAEGWPVVVEAFSPERGQVVNPAAVHAIGTLDVAEDAAIVVVDDYPNDGEWPNVMYAEHVVLRNGSVLDLNGGRLFYGDIEDYGGEIFNGEIIPASFCAEDVDGDGIVGFSDLTKILAAWGPCDDCLEDFDVDGQVGFSDLTQLLAAWGPCGTP